MKKIVLVLAGLAAALAPAAAQNRVRNQPDDLRELHRFTRCVADRYPVSARRVLSTDHREQEYGRRLRNLMDESRTCTTGELRGGGMLFAGALAEAMIQRDLDGRTLAGATAFEPSRPPLQARNGAEYLAFCVVRTHPDQATALLATEPGSTGEDATIATLQPLLAGCVPQGQRAEVNEAGLRALVANGAYRLMLHNRGAEQASGN